MTKVIIVVEGGMVQSVYTRNKKVEIELIDLDTQDPDERDELEKRVGEIEKSKSYQDII